MDHLQLGHPVLDYREAVFNVFEPNRRLLIERAIRLRLSRQDAEDLVSKVLIKALVTNSGFKGKNGSSMITWLTRILINLHKDSFKKVSEDQREFDPVAFHKILEITVSYDLEFLKNKLLGEKLLAELLRNLSPMEGEATRLRFLNGYTVRLTAKIMNVTESAVRSYSSRARVRLKKLVRSDPKFKNYLT